MLNEAMQKALASDVVRPVVAAEIEWPDENMRAHTGVGDLMLNGDLFHGVGNIGSISGISQSSGDSPTRLTLGLSAFDDSVRGEALRAKYQGRPVTVWLVALNDQHQPLATQIIWKGSIVDARVSVGDSNQIEVVVSNRLEDWSKKRPDRFTDESQQVRHSVTGHLRTSTKSHPGSPCYSRIHSAGEHHGNSNNISQTSQQKSVAGTYH